MADITFRLFINCDDGEAKPFDGYNEKKKAEIAKRLSSTMSAYFTAHPNEYERI